MMQRTKELAVVLMLLVSTSFFLFPSSRKLHKDLRQKASVLREFLREFYEKIEWGQLYTCASRTIHITNCNRFQLMCWSV